MQQHHASRGLVYVLAAMAAGANKSLFDIGFAHAERRHSLRELIFLFEADGKRAHAERGSLQAYPAGSGAGTFFRSVPLGSRNSLSFPFLKEPSASFNVISGGQPSLASRTLFHDANFA